jgi:hypothetical protein
VHHEFIVSFHGPGHSFHSVRIEKMSGLGRFEDEIKHALFEFPAPNRKSLVLPRVLRPGLHYKSFKMHPVILRIVIDAPARGALAPPNPLVIVHPKIPAIICR